MARARTWAIRVKYADGREGFVRLWHANEDGPIATFYSKAKAESEAALIRESDKRGRSFTVIERSHGRRDVAAAGRG